MTPKLNTNNTNSATIYRKYGTPNQPKQVIKSQSTTSLKKTIRSTPGPDSSGSLYQRNQGGLVTTKSSAVLATNSASACNLLTRKKNLIMGQQASSIFAEQAKQAATRAYLLKSTKMVAEPMMKST